MSKGNSFRCSVCPDAVAAMENVGNRVIAIYGADPLNADVLAFGAIPTSLSGGSGYTLCAGLDLLNPAVMAYYGDAIAGKVVVTRASRPATDE